MIKNHVEKELLVGLSVESEILYKKQITRHQKVVSLFESMLDPVFTTSNINDLFDPDGTQTTLAACIVKMFTMETFLYRHLTK
eukprot:UN23986